MRLHRNITKLLGFAVTNEDQVGSTYEVIPASEDSVQDGDHGFQVYFGLTQTGGATSPTTTAKLQTSLDKTNWIDVVTSTQLAADGAKFETKDGAQAAVPLLPFVRAVTVLAGGTKPNHTADIRLIASAPFRLKKVT
jgi:hypothetical protein